MPTVNVRSFNGSSDVIRVTAPTPFSGAYTHAAVIKRAATGAFHSYVTIGASGTGNPYLVVTFDNATFLEMRHGGGPATEETYAWNTTNLLLVMITRTGTGAAPRFHVLEGGTWTHQAVDSDSSGDPADWSVESDEELRFGNWNSSFNWFNGQMVMQAWNIGTGLSDGAVEALAGGDRDDYVTAGFDHLWEFNQASTATALTDYIGDLDQIGISGTTVTTFDVPTTVYQFSSETPTAGGSGAVRPSRHRGRFPTRDSMWG